MTETVKRPKLDFYWFINPAVITVDWIVMQSMDGDGQMQGETNHINDYSL
jgi:hypothetical protein